jgi:hypothetical protein
VNESSSDRPEVRWSARYIDVTGEESICFLTDGTDLKTTIRGVPIVGRSPDNLWVAASPAGPPPTALRLDEHGCLTEYVISVSIPVLVAASLDETWGTIDVTWDCRPDHVVRMVKLPTLVVEIDGRRIVSSGRTGDFEGDMPAMEKGLPQGWFLKTCINCQYSDYSVAGTMDFGSMYCFRHLKAEYIAVKSKRDYMKLDDSKAEATQETYLCREFLRRRPRTGYRG